MVLTRLRLTGVLVALVTVLAACGGSQPSPAGPSGTAGTEEPRAITIYSGRNERLVGPLLVEFTKATGIKVEARYGDSAALAAQIVEEGPNSPADVFFSQDAGALGALSKRGLLAPVPDDATAAIASQYRAKDGTWVGTSGRARVIVSDDAKVPPAEVPKSVFELTDPKWKGRIGISTNNASFQSFVTAMRLTAGETRTREWLAGLKANEPVIFPGNGPVVKAVNDGQVALGLVNHYYLFEVGKEIGADKLRVRNNFLGNGDPGSLVNVAGVGIPKSSKNQTGAEAFVSYLVGESAQRYFAESTSEYPLIAGVSALSTLPPLADIQGPKIDLSDLDTIEQSLEMLRQASLL